MHVRFNDALRQLFAIDQRNGTDYKSCHNIFGGIVLAIAAFMALSCAKYADSEPDTFFYCTYFVYLLQYMLTLAIHGARGLRQGCFLIF